MAERGSNELEIIAIPPLFFLPKRVRGTPKTLCINGDKACHSQIVLVLHIGQMCYAFVPASVNLAWMQNTISHLCSPCRQGRGLVGVGERAKVGWIGLDWIGLAWGKRGVRSGGRECGLVDGGGGAFWRLTARLDGYRWVP